MPDHNRKRRRPKLSSRSSSSAGSKRCTIRFLTGAHIDALSLVCTHFHSSPRFVFLMMMACKGLHQCLNDEWWHRFWKLHQAHTTVPRHHYLSESLHGRLRPAQYAHVLRLVYSLRCQKCGARWHHRVIPLLKMRLCPLCLRDNLVSNRVLLFRYGLRACDVVDTHAHVITYFPLVHYRRRERVLRDLTQDPIDTASFDDARTQELMFFWKPDLAIVYDLDDCQARQRARLGAANRLKAAMRRLNLHLHMHCSGRKTNSHTRLLAAYESTDGVPLRAPPLWIPGSPYLITWIPGQTSRNPPLIHFDPAKAAWNRHLMELMRAYGSRPLLGYGEVCAKTWLETFGSHGRARPPLPEDDLPMRVRNSWAFSRNIYHTHTLQRIQNPTGVVEKQEGAESDATTQLGA